MEGLSSSCDSDAQPPPQLVFVYGTLKRGMANHQQLAGARFAGTASVAGLRLYDLGPFPMAICAGDDPEAQLSGEIYAVDPQLLAALDCFEGEPRLFERQQHRLDDGRRAWVYVGRPRQVRHARRINCWPSG